MPIEHRVRVFDISTPDRIVQLERSLDEASADGWDVIPIGFRAPFAAFMFQKAAAS